mgnify:CR=1 FL=1
MSTPEDEHKKTLSLEQEAELQTQQEELSKGFSALLPDDPAVELTPNSSELIQAPQMKKGLKLEEPQVTKDLELEKTPPKGMPTEELTTTLAPASPKGPKPTEAAENNQEQEMKDSQKPPSQDGLSSQPVRERPKGVNLTKKEQDELTKTIAALPRKGGRPKAEDGLHKDNDPSLTDTKTREISPNLPKPKVTEDQRKKFDDKFNDLVENKDFTPEQKEAVENVVIMIMTDKDILNELQNRMDPNDKDLEAQLSEIEERLFGTDTPTETIQVEVTDTVIELMDRMCATDGFLSLAEINEQNKENQDDTNDMGPESDTEQALSMGPRR